jgi:hypothetical protein
MGNKYKIPDNVVVITEEQSKIDEQKLQKLTQFTEDNSLKTVLYQSQKLEKQIAKHYKDTDEQLSFSFMPTNLTRISPFFPMNRRDSKNRGFEKLEWSNSWGDIEIKGEKLSIYDETILLSVLHLVMKSKSRTIKTTRYELSKIIGVSISPSSYKAIKESLERLTGTTIKLSVKGDLRMINTILSGASIDKDDKSLTITLNEYFLATYVKGMITNINLQFRLTLKGDYSKALYRFLVSQRGKEYSCHLLTLAKAINMNINLENREIKRRIKNGLAELKKNGFLTRWFIKNKTEMVYLWKTSQIIK